LHGKTFRKNTGGYWCVTALLHKSREGFIL
jgi:hypothetical protein